MYSSIRIAVKRFYYYLTAHNAKGHGVHSPFVFDFIQNVLNDDRFFYAYQSIENLQKRMLYDTSISSLENFDSTDSGDKMPQVRIADIARSSETPLKYRQLLFRIIDHYAPVYLLELGTSLGITGAYLAMANPSVVLTTFENSANIASLAKANFQKLGIKNIRVIEGDLGQHLSTWLNDQSQIDFVFISGRYQYISIMHYFNQVLSHTHEYSIVVINHIHCSDGMERSWNEMKHHPAVTLSIDLFQMGLIFFRKEFKVKQELAIRF
jgi:predicted O-methyltransferase YrrM